MSEDGSPPDAVGAGARRCPICGKPASVGGDPFCSKRCADVDLHRWLSGSYVIPTDEPEDPEGLTDEEA